MRDEGVIWPIAGFKITHHQELREGIETKLDRIGVDRPPPLGGYGSDDGVEIVRWQPVIRFRNIGKGETEIAAQPLLQSLIGRYVVLAEFDIECRVLGIANEGDGEQDQRRFTRQIGFFSLVPAQESEGEKKDI